MASVLMGLDHLVQTTRGQTSVLTAPYQPGCPWTGVDFQWASIVKWVTQKSNELIFGKVLALLGRRKTTMFKQPNASVCWWNQVGLYKTASLFMALLNILNSKHCCWWPLLTLPCVTHLTKQKPAHLKIQSTNTDPSLWNRPHHSRCQDLSRQIHLAIWNKYIPCETDLITAGAKT